MYDNNIEDIIRAKEGNETAMSKLVENNSGLIWSIVRRFKERGYELDDLYQIGSLRLYKINKKVWHEFWSSIINICSTIYIRRNKKVY
mgnify:CR=1 FL=1